MNEIEFFAPKSVVELIRATVVEDYYLDLFYKILNKSNYRRYQNKWI